MRVSQAVIALAAIGSVSAFTTAPSFGVAQQARLFMSEAVEAEPMVVETPAAPKPEPTGMKVADVRRAITRLTAANFSETLTKLEPFFLNEAGPTFYSKSMNKISQTAKVLGTSVPADYAKAAACTEKRRNKQDEFVQRKIAEAAAAAAEAAEAPAEE